MTPEQLCQRTRRFAVDSIRFCQKLPRTEEGRVIQRQLLRASTSVGAHYRAVCRCRSDADFIAKLGTAIEEADEAGYWLEILVEAAITSTSVAKPLLREADELTRIFVASRETARQNARLRKQKKRDGRIGNQESRIKNHE